MRKLRTFYGKVTEFLNDDKITCLQRPSAFAINGVFWRTEQCGYLCRRIDYLCKTDWLFIPRQLLDYTIQSVWVCLTDFIAAIYYDGGETPTLLIDFNLKKGNEKQNDEQWYKVVDELIQKSKRRQANWLMKDLWKSCKNLAFTILSRMQDFCKIIFYRKNAHFIYLCRKFLYK